MNAIARYQTFSSADSCKAYHGHDRTVKPYFGGPSEGVRRGDLFEGGARDAKLAGWATAALTPTPNRGVLAHSLLETNGGVTVRVVRLMVCCASLLVLSCSSSSTPESSTPGEETDVDDNEGKADGTNYPLGTYQITDDSDQADDFKVATLVFKTDGTFYRYDKGPACDPDGNCQEGVISIIGTYKFCKTSSGGKCARFYDKDGKSIDRLLYTLKGNTLKTKYTAKSYESELVHSTDAHVWCNAASDCSIQGYGNPKCIEGWMCGFQAECLQCLVPAWIDSVKSAYESKGTSSLPEIKETALPERAQEYFAADRAFFGSNSYYKPENMKFYKLTVDEKVAYVSEMKSNGSLVTDVFDDLGQMIASGYAHPNIDFSWEQHTPSL